MNLKRQEAAYLLLLKSVILMKSLLSVGDLDIAVAPLAVARLLCPIASRRSLCVSLYYSSNKVTLRS